MKPRLFTVRSLVLGVLAAGAFFAAGLTPPEERGARVLDLLVMDLVGRSRMHLAVFHACMAFLLVGGFHLLFHRCFRPWVADVAAIVLALLLVLAYIELGIPLIS